MGVIDVVFPFGQDRRALPRQGDGHGAVARPLPGRLPLSGRQREPAHQVDGHRVAGAPRRLQPRLRRLVLRRRPLGGPFHRVSFLFFSFSFFSPSFTHTFDLVGLSIEVKICISPCIAIIYKLIALYSIGQLVIRELVDWYHGSIQTKYHVKYQVIF